MTSATDIGPAVDVLRRGGLVAFPTETVYGLGADATNPVAVRRIFAAKGRPGTNPLIAHVADERVARRYAAAWPEAAGRLAARFWPGPLTLVLPKGPAIADEVTAGLATVGLRVPDHPLALELLKAFDGPVAAPSANRSNHVSPTTAQHVRDDLGNAVDLVVDGGPCAVGIESTVLDLTGPVPRILRPGGVSREQIEQVVGPVEAAAGGVAPVALPAASPGQHAVHYAPTTPAFRFDPGQWPDVVRAIEASPAGSTAVLFAGGRGRYRKQWPGPKGQRTFNTSELRHDPASYAQQLYSTLRGLDAMGLRAIYVEMPPDRPEWAAVRDRLRRATRVLPG